MAIEFSGFPIVFTPTLLPSGYANGDVLFAPEKIASLNHKGNISSHLMQLGIFWDIADAPEISLLFFHKEPESIAAPGNPPALSFDDRIALIGQWDVSESDNQEYSVMSSSGGSDTSYMLVTSPLLSVLNSMDQEGWLVGVLREAPSVDLSDKLKITFIVDK